MGPYRLYLVTLAARRRLSPSFVRITLVAPELRFCSPTLLDQRVKLLVGTGVGALASIGEDWYGSWTAMPDDARPAMRTYTLSAVRADAGEVDVDVVLHDHEGPVGAFAVGAPIGAECLLVAADARRPGHDEAGVAWRPGDARDVLVVADETALPAVANIVATLPADATGHVVVEVPEAGDVRELGVPAGVAVTWCVKADGRRAPDAVAFPAADVTEPEEDLLWEEASGDGWYGWVAGEAGMVRQVRAAAHASGVPKGRIAFMGYWKAGTPGVG